MKKIIFLIIILFTTMFSFGQYNRWTPDVEIGIHSVSDESAISTNPFYHIGAGLRYNFSETFALGLRAGYDNFDLEDFDGFERHLNLTRLNIETTINVFNVLDLNPRWFTLLVHGGPGVAYIKTDYAYKQLVPNMSGGVTGLFKVTKKISIKTDVSIVAIINQDRTLDGSFENSAAGITSTAQMASVGISFSIGKKGSPDFYRPEPIRPITNTYITNDIYSPINYDETNMLALIQVLIDKPLEYEVREYVFFDHDKYNIRETELNAIFKVYETLIENPEAKLKIVGWASPTTSSDKYNLDLSANRSKAIMAKYIDMGIAESRIEIDYYGKDRTFGKESVHDTARRVELNVIK